MIPGYNRYSAVRMQRMYVPGVYKINNLDNRQQSKSFFLQFIVNCGPSFQLIWRLRALLSRRNNPPPGPIVETSYIEWKCPKSTVQTIPIYSLRNQ